jgi:hypothetical protein
MKDQRRGVRVIGIRGGGVRVEFNHDAAGVVGEKVGVRRIRPGAGDAETQMIDVPTGVSGCSGHVQGEVLEFHRAGERAVAGADTKAGTGRTQRRTPPGGNRKGPAGGKSRAELGVVPAGRLP